MKAKTVVFIFFISRLLFFLVGVRFNITPMQWFWQFIDPKLLKTRLLESLFYLHGQPPGFNLLVGVVLKIFPHNYYFVFNALFILIGLAITISFYYLLRQLKISGRLSLALVILFTINPATILTENLFFYDYPVILLLILSALFLLKFCQNKRLVDVFVFFFLLSLLVLTRSMFHLVWFLLLMVWLVGHYQKDRNKIMTAAIIPLFLVFFLYIKNFIIVHQFSANSWMGMGFAKLTLRAYSKDKLNKMVSERKISPLSLIDPFSPLDKYPLEFQKSPKTGIKLLDQVRKSTGYINFNQLNYISISNQYLKDSLVLIALNPNGYLRKLVDVYANYSYPASDIHLVKNNAKPIKLYEGLYNLIVYGGGLYIVFGFPLFVYFSLKYILQNKVKSPRKTVFMFMFFVIMYVFIIGNLFEIDENHRYRFTTEPFILAVVGVLINGQLKVLKKTDLTKTKGINYN
jgi:hypothetical protein